MEGYVTEGDNYVTVVIDTTLTPELIEEGYVREVISKIQTMRKDSDFQVTDRIKVYVTGNAKIAEVMEKNADEIKRVVLGDAFVMDAACDNSKEWNINGEKVTIGVEVSK
jgi:isoleucyl-tRNA synthetase